MIRESKKKMISLPQRLAYKIGSMMLLGGEDLIGSWKDSIAEIYSGKKVLLEAEIARLEKETPGNSAYDDPQYLSLVLKQHESYCNEAIMQDMPKEEREILGKDFLDDYRYKALRLLELAGSYEQNIQKSTKTYILSNLSVK